MKLVKNISVFPAHSDIRKVYAELERTNMKLLIANTDRIFYAVSAYYMFLPFLA